MIFILLFSLQESFHLRHLRHTFVTFASQAGARAGVWMEFAIGNVIQRRWPAGRA
jgi:hypothetical protein